jgi:histidinol dehydrogenase
LKNSRAFIIEDNKKAIDLINFYAPEHLILSVKNYREVEKQIVNAGSVFLGNYTPESAGDYASGTNHTLPTNAYARMFSGVSLESFTKKNTVQEITRQGLQNIGEIIETMAEAEQLFAHKNAVSIRLKYK